MAATQRVKIRVSYLIGLVEAAKKKHVSAHAKKVTEWRKSLRTIESRQNKWDNEFFSLLGDRAVRVTHNYGSLDVEYREAGLKWTHGERPIVTEEPKCDTEKYDRKLSLLNGAAEDFISIAVDDYEWREFL